MRVVTVDEATQAFSALLAGGSAFGVTLQALEEAGCDVVIEAASRLLTVEAGAVLGEKGWAPAEARAAAARRGFEGPARAIVRAVFDSPGDVPTVLRSAWGTTRSRDVVGVFLVLGFLRALPTLPPTNAPAGPVDDAQARLHDKVRALLAKAESTPFEAEAAACTEKAQELMTRHAIDEASVRAGAGAGGRDASASASPTSQRVVIESPYAKPKFVLLSSVGRNNRCQSVWLAHYGLATVFGTAGDLWAVDLLYTSLLTQAAVAMQRERERSRSFRHAFLLSFAHRIGERLREGATSAVAAATIASGNGFLPVLAAREDAVVAARDAAFPRTAALRVSMSNGSGVEAGRAAADRASLAGERNVARGARGVLGRSDG